MHSDRASHAGPHPNPRVVVLCAEGPSTNALVHALQRDIPLAGVVIEPRLSRWKLLRGRARRLGWSRAFGEFLFITLIRPLLFIESRRRRERIQREHGLDLSPIAGIPVVRVPSANTAAAIRALREISPNVVVVNGTRILSRAVLKSVDATFLNVHAGITPLYRGAHGGYWALAVGDRPGCGVTVHVVDHGIDTGPIVAQATITPTLEDNFETYPLLQMTAAIPLLKDAIQRALGGHLDHRVPPEGRSRLWTHPTIWEYLTGRLLRGVR